MIAIHIGMSKAGSSTIQNFFSKNRKELLYLSIDYPDVALSKNNHHNIAQEMLAPRKFDPADGTLNELIAYRKISRKPIMLMSSEVFGFFQDDHVSSLHKSLSLTGENKFSIIFVIRDHVDRVQSSYSQKIKHGHNRYDFDTFFRKYIKDNRINFHSVAERWAAVFGWNNLDVIALDKSSLINGDLIDTFLYTLRPDLSACSAANLDRTEIRNVSPGWRVLEAIRALYSDTHGLSKTHPLLKAVEDNGRELDLGALAISLGTDMGWNAEKGLYLTKRQAQQCLDLYQTNVVSLNGHIRKQIRMPLNLDERGFKARTALPSVELLPRDKLMAFYDQLAERWFNNRRKTNWRRARHNAE